MYKDPWTKTTVGGGLKVGEGVGRAGENNGGGTVIQQQQKNKFSDKFFASISSISFPGKFSCSFIWGLFRCLSILADTLYFFTFSC